MNVRDDIRETMEREGLDVIGRIAERTHLGTAITVGSEIVGCDARFSRLTGYPTESLVGAGALGLVADNQRDMVADRLGREDEQSYSVTLQARDGREIPAVVVPNYITYRDERARVAVFLDAEPVRAAQGQIVTALMSSVQALSRAIETRDPYTAGHQARVGEFAVLIGREIGLSQTQLDHILLGALLHDIGKISIPAEVLVKPTELTPWEWEMIKAHTHIGDSIVAEIDCPEVVKSIVRSHHERLDGSGYPDGLRDADLGHEVRIVSVADALDAITGARPYHGPRTMEDAIGMLERTDGTYDRNAVRAARSLIRSGAITNLENSLEPAS